MGSARIVPGPGPLHGICRMTGHGRAPPSPAETAARYLDSWESRLSDWARDGTSPFAAGSHRPYDRSDAPRPLVLNLALAGNLAGLAAAGAAGTAPDLADFLADPVRSRKPSNGEIDPLGGLAVLHTALERVDRMFAGIDAYRQHPWHRPPETAPAIWRRGAARLLDYGVGGGGPPVLVVPSLINRAHVLDLLPERSLLGWLAGAGHRPLLLDWGEPGPAEAACDTADYVLDWLVPAAECAAAEGPVPVVGYCMGGTFAVALASLRPDLCSRLALVAAPWDFAAPKGTAGLLRDLASAVGSDRIREILDHTGQALGGVPVEFLQCLFALLDPNLMVRKFAGFADLPMDGFQARLFAAAEDWLNDGIPLVSRTGVEVLVDWCLDNTPARGGWRVGGEPVRPERISVPTWVVTSSTDRISPPASSAPLAQHIPQARLREIQAGHIGMMVGSRAEAELWQPLDAWLRS